jgi:hypothetical protein
MPPVGWVGGDRAAEPETRAQAIRLRQEGVIGNGKILIRTLIDWVAGVLRLDLPQLIKINSEIE